MNDAPFPRPASQRLRGRRGFGIFPRFLILVSLITGLVLCFKIGLRIYKRRSAQTTTSTNTPPRQTPEPGTPTHVTASATPGTPASPASAAPTGPIDVASGDLPGPEAMRQIPDPEGDKAIMLAYRYLVESEDLLRTGQVLYELENRFQTLDRKKIYETVDKLRESVTEDREREYLSVLYLDSLILSQTGFSERNDPSKADELLKKISATEHPALGPLSVHRLASVSISNDPRLAMKLFREQIERYKDCPLNGQASFLIGTCHRVLEEDTAALDQYMQTLREYPAAVGQGGDPLEPYIRHALADTYIRIERKEDATGELRTIMECCPDYPYRKQVEAAIHEAEGGAPGASPETGGGETAGG